MARIRIPMIMGLALLATLALPAGAGNVYKCTGENGETRYSSQPCPDAAESERLRVQRPASNTGDDNTSAAGGKTLDEQIAAATDPIRKAQLELRKKECELARSQLERYEGAPYLVEQQEDGTQRRLSEEETAAEKERLRGQIESQCR